MRFNRKDHKRLREVLMGAYREKEKMDIGGPPQIGIMGHIRRIEPVKFRVGYVEFFEQFVWRLVPAACVLILILAVILIQMDFLSDYEFEKILMENPVDVTLFQSLLNM